jgi:UDP-3-O-[3-hydroxymyristoyl] glucosamine N-acyltransferase
MEFSLKQVANLIHGEVKGDGEVKINSLAKIEEAGPGQISFLANEKYEPMVYSTKASALIVSRDFKPKKEVHASLIRVKDPYLAFTELLTEVERILTLQKKGLEEPHHIGKEVQYGENLYLGAFSYLGNNVRLGKNVKIHPQVFVGDNCTIGDNTILFPGAKVYADCRIGNYCTLHSGVVIGSDGFGFAPQDDGSYKKIPQVGNVILEDYVEIGANTTIDCATMGSTIIKQGVKIDNLVMIAHNVELGKDTVIAGQTGIAGSTKIGENVIMAGQVGLVGHINIANKTTIASKTGVSNSIKKEGTTVFGNPAMEIMAYKKAFVGFRRLPDLMDRVKELEQKMVNLAPPGE